MRSEAQTFFLEVRKRMGKLVTPAKVLQELWHDSLPVGVSRPSMSDWNLQYEVLAKSCPWNRRWSYAPGVWQTGMPG